MESLRRIAFVLVPALIVGVLVFLRIGAIGSEKARQKTEAGARKGAAPAVEIATAGFRPIIQTIDAVGTITSEFTVDLSPRIAGRIVSLQVREGESVRAGQVLAQIDPSQADAQILQGRANVNESRSRLAQAEATLEASAIQVEQSIQQARSELTSGMAALVQVRRGVEASNAAAVSAVRQAEAALASAKAELRNREAELGASQSALNTQQIRLKRIRSQYEKAYIAAQEVDDALAAVESAQAGVTVKKGEVESAESDVKAAAARLESDRTAQKSTEASGKAEIEASLARVDLLKAGLKSAESRRSQTPANRENVNALRAGVAAVEAQLQASASQRSDTELRTTISGVVTMRKGEPGSMASPGQPLLRVESIDSLFVNASVPVSQSAKVRKGLPVSIAIEGAEGDPVRGVVDEAVPSADPQDRQFLVRVRLANPGRLIRPGMFARVSIEIERSEPVVVVPPDAVKDDHVTVLDKDDKATRQVVVVGRSDRGGVEITSGLKAGDRVVVLSYTPVKDGAKVSITAERLADGKRKVIEKEKK